MKVLVTYYSQTGNTEKVARAIYEAVTAQKEMKPVAQAAAAGYDLVFCGFPVQAHSVPGKMAEFVKGLPKGQKTAFFATHGSLRGGQLPRQAFTVRVRRPPPRIAAVRVTSKRRALRLRWWPKWQVARDVTYRVSWWPERRRGLVRLRVTNRPRTVIHNLRPGHSYRLRVSAVKAGVPGPGHTAVGITLG